ncbi:MAG: fibronectin type III domain-containing protein [Deltaproteobacteria bacterium]|nr:fibronectin type III domain-containing protein [Deltaproteobacteria bacterium]
MKRIIKVWSDARVQCFLVVLALSFACPAYGIDINLRWDSSVEPDLAGYKIYYKTGSSGPPYNGWDALEGNSPIEIDTYQVLVGNACEYALSDLNESKNYYFVVTAYDAEGNESAYSNEVCFNCADLTEPIQCEFSPDSTTLLRGDTLGFDVSVTNRTEARGYIDFGAKVTMPDGTQSDFVWGPFRVGMDSYQTISGYKTHTIPSYFPFGTYTYQGYVGQSGLTIAECEFDFEVVEAP